MIVDEDNSDDSYVEEDEPVPITEADELVPIIEEESDPIMVTDEDNSDDLCVEEDEPVLTTSGSCGTNATWSYDTASSTLTISGTGAMGEYETSFSVPWKDYIYNITSVVVQSGITSVTNFYAPHITSVSLPDTLKTIGESAFSETELTSVTIPSKVTAIGDNAFECCSDLTSVTIPASVTSIGDCAFLSCSSLTSITIPSGAAYIGSCAFQWCTTLTEVTIPASVTEVSSSAFAGCDSLSKVTFLGKAPKLGDGIFESDKLTAYYNGDSSWVSIVNANTQYGGMVTWKCTASTLATPVLSSVSLTTTGVSVKWSAVAGAAYYRIFYKTAGQDWKAAADTNKTKYTVTGLTSGTKYFFTVCCLSADKKNYTSSYDSTGKAITYIAAPKISSYAFINSTGTDGATTDGVTLKWSAVGGAAKYRVFLRVYDQNAVPRCRWLKIGDTTKTSFTVKDLWKYSAAATIYLKKPTFQPDIGGLSPINGIRYVFTVRCINSAGTSYTSNFYKDGTYTYHYMWDNSHFGYYYYDINQESPFAGTKVTSTSITLKFSGIDEWDEWPTPTYRIYYKKAGASRWTVAANVKGKTSYTFKGLTTGTTYNFRVRPYNGSNWLHAMSEVLTLAPCATPKITSVSTLAYFDNGGSSGVTVKWKKVAGAQAYRVFRKVEGGKWIKRGDTTGTSYFDLGTDNGKKYIYTVRCITKDGKYYTSSYDKTGKSVFVLPTPQLLGAFGEVNWNDVKGAKGYYVYRKVKGGSWSRIGKVTGTKNYYLDTTAKSGKTYYYTVRAYNGSNLSACYSGISAEHKHTWVAADCNNPKHCMACGAVSGERLDHNNGKAVSYVAGTNVRTIVTICYGDSVLDYEDDLMDIILSTDWYDMKDYPSIFLDPNAEDHKSNITCYYTSKDRRPASSWAYWTCTGQNIRLYKGKKVEKYACSACGDIHLK